MDYPPQAKKQAARVETYRALLDLLLLHDQMFTYDELEQLLPTSPAGKVRLAVRHGLNKGDIQEHKLGARLYFGTTRRHYGPWIDAMTRPPKEDVAAPAAIEETPKLTFMVNDAGDITLQRGARVFDLTASEAERFTMFAMNVANLWKKPEG